MTCNAVPWGEANPIAFPDVWKDFTFSAVGETRRVQSTCPYCGGDFSGLVGNAVLAPTGGSITGQAAAPAQLYDVVACDCVLPHAGRPSGTFGCGGSIGVEV